jgi:hypothetical protein
MRTMDLLPAVSLLLFPATACSGTAELPDQASGAAGEGTGGADRVDGGTTANCGSAPAGATPGAYPTTFRFRAPPGQTLYLLDSCGVGFKVSACEDGYTALLVDPYCEDECNGEDTACIRCGACDEQVVTVTDTEGTDAKWSGERYEDRGPGQTGAQCMCYVRRPLTPGRYRVQVPVYSSSGDALDREPAFTATESVDITVPDAVITVTLRE